MAMYGFDIGRSPNVSCTCKEWKDEKRALGILLFSFGTIPDCYSIYPDSHAKAIAIVQRLIQNTADSLTMENGGTDLRYAAVKISDSLQAGNERVRELGQYLGHGIYIGGCITYVVKNQYLAIPFGGARIYQWDGTHLSIKGDAADHTYVTDAIGANPVWEGKGRSGHIAPGSSIISTTALLDGLESCEKALLDGKKAANHPNTQAMILNRIITKQRVRQAGVIEIRC